MKFDCPHFICKPVWTTGSELTITNVPEEPTGSFQISVINGINARLSWREEIALNRKL